MAARLKLAGFLAFFVVFGGCVYYNTFFLAKKNYRLAERIRKKAGGDTVPAEAKPLYDKAIEKASKVLAYYPESKYVDDALFLLGMCFVRTGEYTKALRKFNELLANFPESEFADDARYWRSVCLYYGGKEELAVDSLNAIAREDPNRAEEAAFMLGELAYQKGEYIEAKTAFLDFLDKFPKSSFAPRAHMRLGQIGWHFEEYRDAAEHLEKIREGELSREDYYSVRTLLARCFIKLGRLDEAEEILNDLLADESFVSHWGDVELLVGDVAYARGDTARAGGIWRRLVEKYPKTATAAWAYFRLGEMYFDFGELVLAKEMFDAAAQEVPSGEVHELALQKSAIIGRLLAYRDQIDNADSLGTDVVATELELAEMYLLELGNPDSAISAYRFILEHYPDDSLAPKAAYSMGWVYANEKKDYDTADSVFAFLLSRYPESDYAVGAGRYFKSRGGSLDSLAARNVAYFFVKAEEFWLTYGWPDSALKYYSIVIDSFPSSRWVPKAIAAKAEILASLSRVGEAEKLYQTLSERYPGTPYDSLAKVRLGLVTAVRAEKPAPTKPDTAELALGSSPPTPVDTFRNTYDNLPLAPKPIKPIRLYYPEQEWSSRLQGRKIRIKIKIDPFGKVTDARLLMSCGNEIIDQAALTAAKKAEFDPTTIDISQFNKWFLLEIRVQKPAREEDWE